MKAKAYKTILAVLVAFTMHGVCFANTTVKFTLAPTVLDPLSDVKIVKSACGNFMLLDAKTKHVHLGSKDLDMLATDPGAPDNSLCYINPSANNQAAQIQDDNDADKHIKTYSTTYTVNAGTRLDINNRYGKVTVKTWTKNEFKVDVEVKVSADKPRDATDLLNSISVNNTKIDQLVSFKTKIDKEGQPGVFSNKTSTRKVEINYVVYMPAQNDLSVTNRYGAVELPDLSGKLLINCYYSDLQAKVLSNPANQIKVTYGDARIASLRANDLDISFGSLVLGSVDKLNADVKYSSAKIGKITTSGIISIKYGNELQITDIDKNMKTLLVNSDYTDVKVGLGSNENADFDVTVHYGTFNYGKHPVNIPAKKPVEDKEWNPTQNFKGHVGKGDLTRVININSNYSTVKFD